MHVFLIRHGETEHNVAGLLAGTTDSRLTNHGVLQAQRLANYLVNDRKIQFDSVYASDLQRAFLTADEVCKANNQRDGVRHKLETIKLELLREQDFGSFELVPWSSKQDGGGTKVVPATDPTFKPKETSTAMRCRAATFIDDFLDPLLTVEGESNMLLAVVSHGLFLASLWREILGRCDKSGVKLGPNLDHASINRPLEHIGSWSNTGYLEISIERVIKGGPQEKTDKTAISMVIHAINGKKHLFNLKRTRGGLGSATFDQRQKPLENYFKKPKTD